MRFDDRLATVLRQSVGGEALARIQYRQLLDLLGTSPSDARSPILDSAHRRLAELSASLPATDRAQILRDPAVRLRNPTLVALLAEGEPQVAGAALDSAWLSEEQWLDLIPALPVKARGFLRNRRTGGGRIAALLRQLGVGDRGLPPAACPQTVSPDAPPEHEPSPTANPPDQADEGIGALVRRIEAFRKTRGDKPAREAGPAAAPRLPLGDTSAAGSQVRIQTFDFTTDTEGRIVWSDATAAPMTVGLAIATRDGIGAGMPSPELTARFRRRQPLSSATLEISGAPAIAGGWQVDGTPRFDMPGGRFIGYAGRMRRPALPALDNAAPHDPGTDLMRQMLHELRTPVNAIQGFAEVIQQQLFGAAPHEYRALAASIASDSARILAGFDELDRLVKLEGGILAPETGECDLAEIVDRTVAQLQAYTNPRNSGFALGQLDRPLPAAMEGRDAERLVWRLLATLAGAAAPGEMLGLMTREQDGLARISVRLPAALSALEGDSLFDTAASEPRALAGGILGSGFALRLARAEARASGGSLDRHDDRLCLSIPHLTQAAAFHSDADGEHIRSGAAI